MQFIYSLVRRCVEDYRMIAPGDRVAVGVSGGKDSLMLLAALAGLRRVLPGGFHLEAVTLNMGLSGVELSPVQTFADDLQVPLTVVHTQIAEIVFDIRKESHPCSLCAKMRRGALHDAALNLGCRTVALGHHKNDAVETYLLSLMYEGRIHCFQPVTYLDRKDIRLIRPLLYVNERDIIARKYSLPVVHNPCPANGHTKRQEVKELLTTLSRTVPDIREKIFRAMQSLPLDGWNIQSGGC